MRLDRLGEDKIVGEFRACHVESVTRLCEEVIEAQGGEDKRQHAGLHACVPNGYDDGEQEDREFHAMEIVALQEKRHYQRSGDSKNRKAIAVNR